ncbi:DUF4238 domain-containing protein [Holdemanella biformis]
MKKKEPKKQHYVPKFYLRRFSKKNDNKEEIYVYDKIRNNFFKTNIKNVALENDFYTNTDFEDKYFLEKFFGKNVEPLMESILKEVVQICSSYKVISSNYIIPDRLKSDLAYIIAFQFLRGKYTLEAAYRIAPRIASELINQFREISGYQDYDLYQNLYEMVTEKTFIKNTMWKQMFIQERMNYYAAAFYNKYWAFCVFDEDVLLTCDSPVIVRDSKTKETKPFHVGLIQKDTVIYFAVSPRLLIVLYSKNLELRVIDCKIFGMNDEALVDEYNRANVDQCKSQVYSKSEELLKNVIKK